MIGVKYTACLSRLLLDAQTRGFQYKVVNRILFTNSKLCKFGSVQSSLYTFCGKEEDKLLFFLGRDLINLSLNVFHAVLRKIIKIEEFIAKQKNKSHLHLVKWRKCLDKLI